MSRDNTFYFLGMTFAFSWILWLPSVLEYFEIVSLGGVGEPIYLISLLAGAFGPAFGASMALRREDQSVGKHWKRIFSLSGISFPLLALALLIPLMINGSTILLGMLAGLDIPESRLPSIWLYFPNLLFVTLLGGGQEEIGWRGYLQERAEDWLGSDSLTSIFIGLFWGLWHTPLWFMIYDEHDITPFIAFVIMTMSISIVYGKLYKYSKSMLLAMIFHGSSNAIHALWYLQYLDNPASDQPLYWIYALGNVAFAVIFLGVDHFRDRSQII